MTPEGFTVRRLGCTDYSTTFSAMQTFTDNREQGTPDEMWVLEHEAVFTQGQAGKAEQNSQSDQGGLESKAEGKEEQKTIVQN